jgi:hypothetical protein
MKGATATSTNIPHSYENNFADQEFLPHDIAGTPFYIPGNNSRENGTREFLKNRWKDKYNTNYHLQLSFVNYIDWWRCLQRQAVRCNICLR